MNIEEYRKISHEVDETIGSIFQEYTDAIALFKNDGKFLKMRLLVCFSFAEVVCGIFCKYFNLNLENTELMKKWFAEYCLVNSNTVYKGHLYFNKIDSEYLYQLRCSIVHVFALPEQKGTLAAMFVNGLETAENIKKLDAGFTEKGFTPVFISPDSLTRLFLKGFELLHAKIFLSENVLTKENYYGMERVHKEFYRRGSKPIDLTKNI